MVSSVTSNPYYSYLSQLQTPAATTTTPAVTTSSGSGSSATSTASSLVSSLLGGGYTPETLSLLQENQSGSFDPITDLLGGSGTSDGLTGLYSSLYDSVSAAALTQAQETAAGAGTSAVTGTSSGSGSSSSSSGSSDPVQALINAQTQASVAYNKTLVQNVADTVQSIINA